MSIQIYVLLQSHVISKQSHLQTVSVRVWFVVAYNLVKIYWKPLLETYLFGSKKNIKCQIKFNLNYLT